MRTSIFLLAMSLVSVDCICASDRVSVGVYLPLTGNAAEHGQSVWQGIKLAHRMEPNVLGRPVEVKSIDTRSDLAGATDAAFLLIEKHHVVAMIGTTLSGNMTAASSRAERKRIPVITPTATIPLMARGSSYEFMTWPFEPEQATLAAKFALRQFNATTAAVVYDISDENSFRLAVAFRDEFNRAGGKIVREIRCKRGDRDFAGQINLIKAARSDVVYAPIHHTECALMTRHAREMAINVPIMASEAVLAPKFLELGGKAVEDLVFTTYFQEEILDSEIGKLIRGEPGNKMRHDTAMGAKSYFVILEAIRRAGSSNPEDIRNALAAASDSKGIVSGISAQTFVSHRNNLPVIYQVKGGRFVQLPFPDSLDAIRRAGSQ